VADSTAGEVRVGIHLGCFCDLWNQVLYGKESKKHPFLVVYFLLTHTYKKLSLISYSSSTSFNITALFRNLMTTCSSSKSNSNYKEE